MPSPTTPAATWADRIELFAQALQLAQGMCRLPWYLLVPERSAVRVFHCVPDLPRRPLKAYIGDAWLQKMESVVRVAANLPSVPWVIDRAVVELRVPADRFPAVALALRMEFGYLAETAPGLLNKLLLDTCDPQDYQTARRVG